MDKLKIIVINQMSNPQQVIWSGMHQCYCFGPVTSESELIKIPDETKAGELVVKHLLSGHRGHYSPTELATIVTNVIGFPHSFLQQLTRHRVAISFSVQSFRYTSQGIIDVANGDRATQDVFYFRKHGEYYLDRNGNKYLYSYEDYLNDLEYCHNSCLLYKSKILAGFSEEHARDVIPYNIRQHFVLGLNARSLMHVLDLRWKKDAQLEAQIFCNLLFEKFQTWTPAIAQWYLDNRAKKARLSP